VILHDGIKTIQKGVFLFSLKKEQNLCFFKKNKKSFFLTQVGVGLKKTGFSQPCVETANSVPTGCHDHLFVQRDQH